MIRKYVLSVTLLTLALAIGGCQDEPETSTVKTSDVNAPDETAANGASSEPEIVNGFDAAYLELGRDIVKTQCVACHNAEPTGASPREDAPPLRHVLANYNPDALANDFRERIHVGHPDMPDFKFSILQIEGLLAYLSTIQEPPETVH